MMEAADSFETFLNFCQNTRRHISKDISLYKSYSLLLLQTFASPLNWTQNYRRNCTNLMHE